MTPPEKKEQLQGTVERITYHNSENGFCVLQVRRQGQKNMTPVIGSLPSVEIGEHLRAEGLWKLHKNHGLQFQADTIEASQPKNMRGMEKYLSSGALRGIGPAFAKKILSHFGQDIFEVLEKSPHRLASIPGIGEKKIATVIKSWDTQRCIRDIMLFLHEYQIGPSHAVRIHKTYGKQAIDIIRDNPYTLVQDIRGIGFKTADQIAQKIGIAHDSPQRIRAGLFHALLEARDDGHCGLPEDILADIGQAKLEVDDEKIRQAIDHALKSGDLILTEEKETAILMVSPFYYMERAVAERLKTLEKGDLPWKDLNIEEAVEKAQEKIHITLADSQKKAILGALQSKISVITGGPGVGKTTIVRTLLQALREANLKFSLSAPTGRAAKRLSESTRCPAKTIHRLLEVNPAGGGFTRNEDKPLKCDLLILDEVSMVDLPLMNSLVKAIPPHAALILVGDVDQLPSVGPGKILQDLIESEAFPVFRLTEVFRQAKRSNIIRSAHNINQGFFPHIPEKGEKSDLYFIAADDSEDVNHKIIYLIEKRIPQIFQVDAKTDIQILCPMNRGTCGTKALNYLLQSHFNPSPQKMIERFGWKYAIGDKVMQIQNDYDKDVFNGDIGYIKDIDIEEDNLIITFDHTDVSYTLGELDNVVPAYAITIHKSQGSEYPVVILPIVTQHFPMLKKKLLYTGVTRGKKLVILIGQKKALAMALKAKEQNHRWTNLQFWLK